MSPTAFKIAEGFVEIKGRLDRAQIRMTAQRAGDQFGDVFGKAFRRRLGRDMNQFVAMMGNMAKLNMPTMGQQNVRQNVNVRININNRQATAQASRAGSRAADAFNRAWARRMKRWTKQFERAINDLFQPGLLASIPKMVAMQIAMMGIRTAVVALLSSLGKAGMSMAALIPAWLSFASVIGVAKLALGSLGDPVMKQVMKALDALSGELKKVAKDAALPGIKDMFTSLLKLAPLVVGYIKDIATIIGDTARSIGKLAETPLFQAKLASLLGETSKATSIWMSTLEPILDIIVTLGDAAAPIFTRFVTWIRDIVMGFRLWINEMHATGKLQEMLKGAADEMARWGRIVGNFLVGIIGLFSATTGHSERLAAGLERISEAFRSWAWSEDTHGKIREFMEFMINLDYGRIFQIAAAITAIGLALKGILAGIGVVQALLGLLALGPVALIIAAVAGALAVLAGAMVYAYTQNEGFRERVVNTWNWIRDNVFPIAQRWWEWMTSILGPALKEAGRILREDFMAAWNVVSQAIRQNEGQLRALWNVIGPLIGAFWSSYIPTLARFAGILLITVAGAISASIQIMSFWVRVIQGVGDALGLLGRSASTAAGGVATAFSWMGGVVVSTLNWIRGAVESAGAAFDRLVGRASGTLSRVSAIAGSIRGMSSGIGGFIGGMFAHGGIIGAASGGARGGLTLVGEQGPELVKLPRGSMVKSNPDTQRMMAQGGQSGPVVLEIKSGGSKLDDLLVEILRGAVRTRGGNVQVALGR